MSNMDEKAIQTFVKDWAEIEQQGDIQRLAEQLSDDFVAVGPFGFLLNKSEWIERLESKKLQYKQFAIDQVQVRFFDNVAIVIARQTQNGTYEGNPIPDLLRTTLILHKVQDDWQLVGQHISLGRPPMPVGQ